MNKWRNLFVFIMVIVFIMGLLLCLYPHLRGAVIEDRIQQSVEFFMEQHPLVTENVPDGTEAVETQPRQCPELWDAMVAYNEAIYKDGQTGLSGIDTYESPSFIVFVDYERSSWRYMNYERNFTMDDLECYKIGGSNSLNRDIMAPYRIAKGGGSAYGGEWRPNPNKPSDQRFLGNPGQINQCGY